MALSLKQKIVVAAIIFYTVFAWVSAAQAAIIKPANNLGLVGYWSFDEHAGATAYDHSGQGNNVAVSSTAWVQGKVGGALSFNGANAYASVPNSAAYKPTSAVTIAVWANMTTSASGSFVDFVRTANHDGQGYLLRWSHQDSRVQLRVDRTSNSFVVADTQSNSNYLNGWHYFVATYDSATGQAKLYVDGVLRNTTSGLAGSVQYDSSPLYVMGYPPDGDYLPGKADELRVYSRALSQGEIQALYNRTAGTRVGASSALANGSTLANGLVGWWTFDGADTTDKVYDRAGGNNGYFIGGATSTAKVQGKLGQALEFNGSSDRVAFTAPSIANSSFSFAGWVYEDSTAVDKTWFSIGSSGTQNNAMLLRVRGAGGMRFGFFSNDLDTADGVFTRNTWHFVACTYNVTTGERVIYLDGAQVARNASGVNAFTGDTAASIGNWVVYGNENWPGKIDEVRLYNRALTAQEVAQLYRQGGGKLNTSGQTLQDGSTLSQGLAGYWSFNGPDTTDKIYDRSGNGNNGYLNPGVSTSSMKAQGKSGQAFSWDGASKYVVIPSSGSINSSDATIAGWFKFGAQDAYQTMVAKWYTGVQQQFVLQYNADNLIGWWTGNGSTGGNVLESTGSPQLGHWYFIVATISGTSKKLYINGVLDNSGTGSAIGTNGVELTIGAKKNSGGAYFEPFNGLMDEVRIYNRALTPSEVWQLYIMSGGPVVTPPPPGNPAA